MALTLNLTQLKRKKRKDGTIPIYIRITEDRKSRYKSTGIAVLPKHWNRKKQKIRKSHRRDDALNRKLRGKLREIEEKRDSLEKKDKLSLNNLKQTVSKKNDSTSILSQAEAYRKKLKTDDRYWERRHFKVVIGNLKRFIEEKDKSQLLDQIDTEWLEDFQSFLLSEGGPKIKGTRKRKDNSNNTVRKKLQRLRGMFNHLIKIKELKHDPFTGLQKVEAKRTDTKSKLTYEQIETIENLTLTEGSKLWHARNYFLYSFYNAGIRFGDLCCLRWHKLIDGRLVYKMNKTGKWKSIKQFDSMKEILRLYRTKNSTPNDYIFPLLDQEYEDPMELRRVIGSRNAQVNKQLKILASKAGIEANVSFHVSRHSFAQYALKKDMDLYSISKALGHSDLKITEQYLKSFDEEKLDNDMEKIFK